MQDDVTMLKRAMLKRWEISGEPFHKNDVAYEKYVIALTDAQDACRGLFLQHGADCECEFCNEICSSTRPSRCRARRRRAGCSAASRRRPTGKSRNAPAPSTKG